MSFWVLWKWFDVEPLRGVTRRSRGGARGGTAIAVAAPAAGAVGRVGRVGGATGRGLGAGIGRVGGATGRGLGAGIGRVGGATGRGVTGGRQFFQGVVSHDVRETPGTGVREILEDLGHRLFVGGRSVEYPNHGFLGPVLEALEGCPPHLLGGRGGRSQLLGGQGGRLVHSVSELFRGAFPEPGHHQIERPHNLPPQARFSTLNIPEHPGRREVAD